MKKHSSSLPLLLSDFDRAQLSSISSASSLEISVVFPAIIELLIEFVAGIVIQDIYIQFTLLPVQVRLLLPKNPTVGVLGSLRWIK